jgi:deoxyribodipyrimidine photo-lyase
MDKPFQRALVWLRRDLRASDHAALYHALKAAHEVYLAFVFDRSILDPLPRTDRRVQFIHGSLIALDQALAELKPGAGLIVRHGWAHDEVPALAQALAVQAVFANHDYEPQAKARDTRVRGLLADMGIAFKTYKDQVVFETDEVLTANGKPYGVFTPYKSNWLRQLNDFQLKPYPVAAYAAALAVLPRTGSAQRGVPSLQQLGFEETNLASLKIVPGERGAQELVQDFVGRMDAYDHARDYPAVKGPSYLSVHLRFGTVSVRQLAKLPYDCTQAGQRGAAVWLSELIWREFYMQVLHHHPHVAERAFKPAYDAIRWEHGKHAEALFSAWCEGRTGYPLVDAAMAQINQTGYMHNRLRMVVASFLTKDLGIDWRWGERYFAEKLNDFDLSANNGGWQWASSSGCDAQPYFRIFNPVSQSERFDAQGKFIRRYLPQLAALPDAAIHAPWLARPVDLASAGLTIGKDYPGPVVQHDEARKKTLERYAVVKTAPA